MPIVPVGAMARVFTGRRQLPCLGPLRCDLSTGRVDLQVLRQLVVLCVGQTALQEPLVNAHEP